MYRNNLWQSIVCDGVTDTMRLLGCDEKYISGNASDFEKFRDWIAAYPYMEGNVQAKKAAEDLSLLLGRVFGEKDLCGADAKRLWLEYERGEMCGETVSNSCDEKSYNIFSFSRVLSCDEKEKIIRDYVDLSDMLGYADASQKATLDDFENFLEFIGKSSLGIKVDTSEFIRPDKYHAEVYYSEFIRGENSKSLFFMTQILLDMTYKNKCGIIHIELLTSDAVVWAEDFLNYLSLRDIPVSVAVRFHKDNTPEEVRRICLIRQNVYPVSALFDEEYIRPFAKVIPRGILCT